MGTWNEFLQSEGAPPEWPYPIKFGEEKELEADVVVLGGDQRRAQRSKGCPDGEGRRSALRRGRTGL